MGEKTYIEQFTDKEISNEDDSIGLKLLHMCESVCVCVSVCRRRECVFQCNLYGFDR